jgi:hypothetical protein
MHLLVSLLIEPVEDSLESLELQGLVVLFSALLAARHGLRWAALASRAAHSARVSSRNGCRGALLAQVLDSGHTRERLAKQGTRCKIFSSERRGFRRRGGNYFFVAERSHVPDVLTSEW